MTIVNQHTITCMLHIEPKEKSGKKAIINRTNEKKNENTKRLLFHIITIIIPAQFFFQVSTSIVFIYEYDIDKHIATSMFILNVSIYNYNNFR